MRFAPLLVATLAGCVQHPAAAPPSSTPVQPAATSCPIVQSSDWRAWVNAMPGPGSAPTLIVTGKVVVPTGGYRIDWGQPLVMESYPVQVRVELIPTRSQGRFTQALVTKEVRGEWPMREPVGALTITCGPKTLARIAPVETAH
ncbi:MAG: hypothetical protein ABIW58_09850 [Sphingomicrobium sp.]